MLLLYWIIGYKKYNQQNFLLLIASYFFYGLWDWRFLFLIIGSSLLDYFTGLAIANSSTKTKKRFYLFLSVFWNLGVLFTFKYFNFFIAEFATLFNLPLDENVFSSLHIILPVGLSFYTFQTLSYSLDVYLKKYKPTTNLLQFLCFVSFFPQLVAGPIERARALLPQFEKEREFSKNQFIDGLRQILWGLFKKIVVADNVAIGANLIFSDSESYGALSLFYGSALFFFQIYCDFSGYSDIAIGSAKLFGFKLSTNFKIPYISRTVAEFWQRWHITLTRWFTEYVYTPILKKFGKSYFIKSVALFIAMALIGFWHGANWTFLCFGMLQAIWIATERVPLKYKGRNITISNLLNNMPLIFAVTYSFVLISTSCIFFRATTMSQALQIIFDILTLQSGVPFSLIIGFKILVIPFLIVAEYFTQNKNHPLESLEKLIPNTAIRWSIYYVLIFIIFRYAGPTEQFIYFQF